MNSRQRARQRLYLATGHRFCFHCGTTPADTMDHVLPKKDGGSILMVLACNECNAVRATYPINPTKVPLAKKITLRYMELMLHTCAANGYPQKRLQSILSQWPREWETYHKLYGA